MENDSIRASGSDTLVDIWIDGKIRAISISQEAIGAFLGFERMAGMSEVDRCAFVRNNLPLVVAAAKARLREAGPTAATIMIDAGQLPRPDGRMTDRRKSDRRKGDRRNADHPLGDKPDRRRASRRRGERRSRAPKSES